MGILAHTSCYLGGAIEIEPHAAEWRARMTQELSGMDITVLNPLVKPEWVGPRCLRSQADINEKFFDWVVQRAAGDELRASRAEEALQDMHIAREICLRLVYTANWSICRLPKTFTVGTFEELTLLARAGTPVMFICPDGIPSMWLASMFVDKITDVEDVFFKDEDHLLTAVRHIDEGKRAIDPKRWIFLTWTQKGQK
jgi:hypothetical protein